LQRRHATILFSAAVPFCILDLALRALEMHPPGWLGDALSTILLFLSGRFFIHAWNRGRRRADSADMPAQEWQATLPCLMHEIRNYSSVIKGNARLLRSRIGDDADLAPLGRLERTTEKIESLAREILEGADLRQDSLRKSLCPRALLENAVSEHFHECREMFRIEPAGPLPRILGDAGKLERAFLNLFRNAREAGARTIRIRFETGSDRLRILVEDDGPGCPAEALPRLFQPLYSTKKAKGGTGLGLYMVKGIMQSHGGDVRAVSKSIWAGNDTGMIFCLDFPLIGMKSKRKPLAGRTQVLPLEGIAG
jgi:signal transduction histidine kinase